MLEHGLSYDERLLLNDRDERGKYIDIQLPEQMPTAFVCNCDQVAYNLCERLTGMGYSIPQDFSVVGFDNDIYATLTNPQLTTVEVDIQEMARTAVKSIMDKVSNPNRRNGRVLVQGNIIYRDSVRKIL
ncbi:Arabinose metabolism transcriptional repressor [compost metagenome]